MSGDRPLKLAIAALGGQGGGVLSDWLIDIAEGEGYLVQATSVPGVAQRTGATLYYLEFFPKAVAERHGREPVFALMPLPGDVDCVLAAELAEAGRAVQRGLVTPDRTVLIASSHRSFTISEKSAMGAGAVPADELQSLVAQHAQRLILFDMDALAARHRSVISSVLLGALCGSGVLPFRKAAFEAAIRHGGIAVETNLEAFEAACTRARETDSAQTSQEPVARAAGSAASAAPPSTLTATTDSSRASAAARRPAELQSLVSRVQSFPEALQPLLLAGVRRMLDYQDPRYAELYLERLERIAALEPRGTTALTEAVARQLALWMSFEDVLRVAELKTRAVRFERVRAESGRKAGEPLGISDFVKPRVEEIAGTLPCALGQRALESRTAHRVLASLTRGRRIRTHTISGFLLLYVLGGLKRFRRGTLRYRTENALIGRWLDDIEKLAHGHHALAVELARLARLIKGYGDTHARSVANFARISEQLEALAARPDGADLLARLQKAALADEAGETLDRELAALTIQAPATAAAGIA